MVDSLTLDALNTAPVEEAAVALRRCNGVTAWVEGMLALRPFASIDDVYAKAEEVADGLAPADWLEAFSHHPKIGSLESLRNKFAKAHTREWSAGEQAGVREADEEVLQALAQANEEYEQRFGYIFIICATGKSAREMLDILHARLPNSPDRELMIAASEQRKITRIRLEKMLQ